MDRTRRDALRAGAVAGALGLAGCLGFGSGTPATSGKTVDSLPTPTMGAADASVTVKAFEDYACPHCQHFQMEVFPKIVSTYVDKGVVRYEHHDFPIPVDQRWSWQAASAARGVQDHVGDDAFFTFTHDLYGHLGNYSLDLIGSIAAQVGADKQTIENDATNETYKPVLTDDRKQGLDMGVQGTPTVFVNGTKLATWDWNTVSSAIDSAKSG